MARKAKNRNKKEFKEIENRTATVQRENRTLTMIPSIKKADGCHFQMFLDRKASKIRMNLYSFPKPNANEAGKKEWEKYYNIFWNWDIDSLELIRNCVVLRTMPTPFEGTKFLSDYPCEEDVKDGKSILSGTKGLCLYTHIYLSRDAYKADSKGRRSISGTPWFLKLERAYGRARSDGSGEPDTGSFIYKAAANIALTDEEMINLFSWAWRRVELELQGTAPAMLKFGRMALEHQNGRGQYTERMWDLTIHEAEIEKALEEQEQYCSSLFRPTYRIQDFELYPNEDGVLCQYYDNDRSVGFIGRRCLCIGSGLAERYRNLGEPTVVDLTGNISYETINEHRYPVINVKSIDLPCIDPSLGNISIYETLAQALSQKTADHHTEQETAGPEMHTGNILLKKIGKKDGITYAIGEINGKSYQMILDSFGEKHKEAYEKKQAITLQMYQINGQLHCC